MTKIIFIINDTQIALTKSPDPLDQVLDRIAAQTFPLPADTRPEDWAAINGVLWNDYQSLEGASYFAALHFQRDQGTGGGVRSDPVPEKTSWHGHNRSRETSFDDVQNSCSTLQRLCVHKNP